VAVGLAKNNSEQHSGESLTSADSPARDRDEQSRVVADAWLGWQCRMVAGVVRAAVFSTSDGQLKTLLTHWPASFKRASTLGIIAAHSLGSGGVHIQPAQESGDTTDQAQDHIAIPISNDGGDFVVVMQILSRSKSQQQAVVQLVQWGGMWLGSLDTVVTELNRSVSSVSIDLAEQVLSHDNLYAACLEAANRLKLELQCDRVSVGLKKGAVVELQAISQISQFDQRRALVRAIEAAMEEALDQDSIINIANTESAQSLLTRAHSDLQLAHGAMLPCTIPLYCNDESVGAVLLERQSERGFANDAVNRAANALEPMGPVLQLISKEQRSVLHRTRDWFRNTFSRRNLPTTVKGRVIAGIGCLVALGLLFVPVPHNISAQARIEGSDNQVLVAPHVGYIKSAHARAGDRVKAGQVIASLEDRELVIEKERWLGELGKLETSLARALSLRDRSELGTVQAKKAQVDAELALIERKLSRSQLTAPFDGVLVSGDLNQALGAPVEVGQVLFEVTSMNSYRLLLEVNEHDVADIEPGQSGVLRFSALPGNKHKIQTSNVMPVAITRDRKSVFSLEAKLTRQTDKLRPGMRGLAKIRVGEKPLVWIWTNGLIAKMRLWLWKTGF